MWSGMWSADSDVTYSSMRNITRQNLVGGAFQGTINVLLKVA